ncbi:MAG: hypothetical protein KTR25_17015 [Myxococcales bacterium]|nr:hypothetical protein [Myxococcales bacterium]
MTRLFIVLIAVLVGVWGITDASARPYKPGEFSSEPILAQLQKQVGARDVPIEDFCRKPSSSPCRESGLTRFRAALDELRKGRKRKIRILKLGDSHIASDFISGYVRHELQEAFGVGGRGLMHADQRWGYGGRKLERAERPWKRTRVVDSGGPGHPFGVFGIALKALKPKVFIDYRVLPDDTELEVHYKVGPGVPGFVVLMEGKVVGHLSAKSSISATQIDRLPLPPRTRPGRIRIRAKGRGATIYGVGFERSTPGVVLSSIGPVGADAKVYLQLEPKSFRKSLKASQPDLVILMVGGNDALKVRKKWKSLDTVVDDHRILIDLLRDAVPQADILLMSPMDAGRRQGKKVVSKALLQEMRAAQNRIAREKGTAFWDTYTAMGGEGAIQRWVSAKVMSRDLVHPRKRAADLLGKLLADAIIAWYER